MKPFGLLCLTALLLASCESFQGPKKTAQSYESPQGLEKPALHQPVSYSGSRAESLTEGQRTVTGRISFKKNEDIGTELILHSNHGEAISVTWPKWAPDWRKIDTTQEYRAKLLTRIYTKPDYVFDDLLRLSNKDRLIFDNSICHLHHLTMSRQLEDETDACDYPESFFPLQKKKFPNDGMAYLACGSGISHPTWRCPTCSSLYRSWVKKHKSRFH